MISLLSHIVHSLFRRPVTRAYPFVRREPCAGSRGHLEIEIEKCSFCGMCQKRCPSGALAVSRAPKSWTLDPYACIVCNYCVEVCPRKCLAMSPVHRPPSA